MVSGINGATSEEGAGRFGNKKGRRATSLIVEFHPKHPADCPRPTC
jgi:hypothetical protein